MENQKNVHSHTANYDFLKKYLPKSYVAKTQAILKKDGVTVTDNVVRNVKAQKSENMDVLKALLTVAESNKELATQFAENTI